jgi:hypothetical protein
MLQSFQRRCSVATLGCVELALAPRQQRAAARHQLQGRAVQVGHPAVHDPLPPGVHHDRRHLDLVFSSQMVPAWAASSCRKASMPPSEAPCRSHTCDGGQACVHARLCCPVPFLHRTFVPSGGQLTPLGITSRRSEKRHAQDIMSHLEADCRRRLVRLASSRVPLPPCAAEGLQSSPTLAANCAVADLRLFELVWVRFAALRAPAPPPA